MRVNFQENNKNLTINYDLCFKVIIFLGIILLLIFVYLYNYNFYLQEKSEVEELREKSGHLSQLTDDYIYYIESIKNYEQILMNHDPQYFWHNLLLVMEDIFPAEAGIKCLRIEDENFIIEGQATKSDIIMEIADNIRESTLFTEIEMPQFIQNDNYFFELKGKINLKG